jgi:hypothetical protein
MIQRPFFAIDRIDSRLKCEFFAAISLPASWQGIFFPCLPYRERADKYLITWIDLR